MARLNTSERDTVLKGINMMRRINRELLDTYTVDIKTISDAEDVWMEMKDVFGGDNFRMPESWYGDVTYRTDAEVAADKAEFLRSLETGTDKDADDAD